jgi:hypothetical protein
VQETASIEKLIDSITKNLSKPYFRTLLVKLAASNARNAAIICEHILAEQTAYNAKPSTIEGKIKRLVWLSSFLQNKDFAKMTKKDILLYLNSLRKPLDIDPSQKWIGFHNN